MANREGQSVANAALEGYRKTQRIACMHPYGRWLAASPWLTQSVGMYTRVAPHKAGNPKAWICALQNAKCVSPEH